MDQAMPSLQKSQNPTSYQSMNYFLSPPSRRYDCVNIDIVGPLVPSEGNRFLLTMVDRFTRWPESIPLKEVTTFACAKAFVSTLVSVFECLLTFPVTEAHSLFLNYGPPFINC